MLLRPTLDEGDHELDEDLVESMRPLARVLLIVARRKLAKGCRDNQVKRLAA